MQGASGALPRVSPRFRSLPKVCTSTVHVCTVITTQTQGWLRIRVTLTGICDTTIVWGHSRKTGTQLKSHSISKAFDMSKSSLEVSANRQKCGRLHKLSDRCFLWYLTSLSQNYLTSMPDMISKHAYFELVTITHWRTTQGFITLYDQTPAVWKTNIKWEHAEEYLGGLTLISGEKF